MGESNKDEAKRLSTKSINTILAVITVTCLVIAGYFIYSASELIVAKATLKETALELQDDKVNDEALIPSDSEMVADEDLFYSISLDHYSIEELKRLGINSYNLNNAFQAYLNAGNYPSIFQVKPSINVLNIIDKDYFYVQLMKEDRIVNAIYQMDFSLNEIAFSLVTENDRVKSDLAVANSENPQESEFFGLRVNSNRDLTSGEIKSVRMLTDNMLDYSVSPGKRYIFSQDRSWTAQSTDRPVVFSIIDLKARVKKIIDQDGYVSFTYWKHDDSKLFVDDRIINMETFEEQQLKDGLTNETGNTQSLNYVLSMGTRHYTSKLIAEENKDNQAQVDLYLKVFDWDGNYIKTFAIARLENDNNLTFFDGDMTSLTHDTITFSYFDGHENKGVLVNLETEKVNMINNITQIDVCKEKDLCIVRYPAEENTQLELIKVYDPVSQDIVRTGSAPKTEGLNYYHYVGYVSDEPVLYFTSQEVRNKIPVIAYNYEKNTMSEMELTVEDAVERTFIWVVSIVDNDVQTREVYKAKEK